MISYTKAQKIKESIFGRDPVKRTHRKVVVFAKMDGKLSLEIHKRVEFVGSIKIFVIFAVRTFHFSVVSRGEGTNQLMGNLSLFERALKERKITRRGAAKALGEFKSVVGLHTIHRKAELFEVVQHMNQELR